MVNLLALSTVTLALLSASSRHRKAEGLGGGDPLSVMATLYSTICGVDKIPEGGLDRVVDRYLRFGSEVLGQELSNALDCAWPNADFTSWGLVLQRSRSTSQLALISLASERRPLFVFSLSLYIYMCVYIFISVVYVPSDTRLFWGENVHVYVCVCVCVLYLIAAKMAIGLVIFFY